MSVSQTDSTQGKNLSEIVESKSSNPDHRERGQIKKREGSDSSAPAGYSTPNYPSHHSGTQGFAEGAADRPERPRAAAMEVVVDNNIEKAMKVLKRKLIKEGLFKELKSRRYYEKPSEKKKRKHKESVKKVRKEELRQKRNAFLFS